MATRKKIHIEENRSDSHRIRLNKKVSTSFFEELENEILKETIYKKKVSFPYWAFSAAAAIVLFLGLFIVFKSSTTIQPNVAVVSTEVILDNIELEYTNEEIASFISMAELNSLEEEIWNEFKQIDISDEIDVLDMYDKI